jgi:hypothetical protein
MSIAAESSLGSVKKAASASAVDLHDAGNPLSSRSGLPHGEIPSPRHIAFPPFRWPLGHAEFLPVNCLSCGRAASVLISLLNFARWEPPDIMITEEDEKELREKIRKSLEQFEENEPSAFEDGLKPDKKDPDRAREIETIVSDETDKYFQQKGLVKHISSSGRVYWLTPEEEAGWERRHTRRRKKKKTAKRKMTKKEILFYVFFLLAALVTIIVLFRTAVFY